MNALVQGNGPETLKAAVKKLAEATKTIVTVMPNVDKGVDLALKETNFGGIDAYRQMTRAHMFESVSIFFPNVLQMCFMPLNRLLNVEVLKRAYQVYNEAADYMVRVTVFPLYLFRISMLPCRTRW